MQFTHLENQQIAENHFLLRTKPMRLEYAVNHHNAFECSFMTLPRKATRKSMSIRNDIQLL